MTVHEPVRRDVSARLGRYLLMSGAACGAAGTQFAEAAIVTSAPGWSLVLTASGSAGSILVSSFGPGAALLDSNLVLSARYVAFTAGSNRAVFAYGTNGALMNAPRRFRANDIISNIAQISGATQTMMVSSSRANNSAAFVPQTWGSWQAPDGGSLQGYLAFAISDGASNYYFGYFDVTLSNTGRTGTGLAITLTVHSWAYNSVAGQAITIPGAAAVPGGTGLAALAFGASGLRGRRRSRN